VELMGAGVAKSTVPVAFSHFINTFLQKSFPDSSS